MPSSHIHIIYAVGAARGPLTRTSEAFALPTAYIHPHHPLSPSSFFFVFVYIHIDGAHLHADRRTWKASKRCRSSLAGKAEGKQPRTSRGAARDRGMASAKKETRAVEASTQLQAQAAVAEALVQDSHRRNATLKEMDEYGKGLPTDRLQFGYAPAIAEEAVAFHRRISAADWVEARRRVGHRVFAKHQKSTRLHCEPITSVLKLRHHWNQQSLLQADYRKDLTAANRRVAAPDQLEGLLDLFAVNTERNGRLAVNRAASGELDVVLKGCGYSRSLGALECPNLPNRHLTDASHLPSPSDRD
eukprot:gene4608-3322_t